MTGGFLSGFDTVWGAQGSEELRSAPPLPRLQNSRYFRPPLKGNVGWDPQKSRTASQPCGDKRSETLQSDLTSAFLLALRLLLFLRSF
jgi:hypothetical protein